MTAVGAVVAAGLTPGIIAATPACMPGQNPSAVITAAEVVAIDGNAYSFDELYAMQQPTSGPSQEADPQVAARYGVMPPPQATYYGVQHPGIRPDMPRPRPQQPPGPTPQEIALDTIAHGLVEYCAQMLEADGRLAPFSLESDLTRDLGFDDYQLKDLAEEIKERYGVEVSYHRFKLVGQLNTLRLVTEYIYRLKTVWQ